jgi:transposase
VATTLVKLACFLPDDVDRSLSHWTCAELADQLHGIGVVESISISQVHRMLSSHKLKPWRVHHWLTPKATLDQVFLDQVNVLQDLYTRPKSKVERILCLDEMTSLQPRPRKNATKPAKPGNEPVRVEHEYKRAGALNLIAAFDVHSGLVTEVCRPRKRQIELIELLEKIDEETPRRVKTIWLVCDNVSMHKGKLVQEWMAKHPRFKMAHPPVHCSWMNQVEQWFSIIKRKRLTFSNFKDCDELEQKIHQFVDEWNEKAHPFDWSTKSFEKIVDRVEVAMSKAA